MGYLREEEAARIAQSVIDRFLIPHFMELEMNATGEWKSNVGYNIEMEVDGATINFRARKYTEQLVNGAPPGTSPRIKDLAMWVQAKLHIGYPKSISAAHAVKNKIEKEGTEYYKQGGTDLVEILESDEVINFVQREVNSLILPRITVEVQRKIQELAWA